GLQLRVRQDDVGLFARVGLHLLGQPLRGGQRLLQQLLAVLELVDPGLPAPQLLVLLVQLPRHLLELARHEVEERPHFLLVEAAEPGLAEGLLLQVEGRQLHGSEDTPAVKVPLRSPLASPGCSLDGALWTPPRAIALTRYIASSATRSSDSGSRASSGNAATPTDAVSLSGPYG